MSGCVGKIQKGDEELLVEVRRESGKMLYFQHIGVSLAFLASVLAGLMARRVEIETLLWYY